MKPRTIATICTFVAGIILVPTSLIIESPSMLVIGFVSILVFSGLTWAHNQAELDKMKEEERKTGEES